MVTSVSLRTVYLGPALAWQATSRLSLGLSVSYVYADFALGQRNALQFVTGDPEANPNPDRGVEGDTRIEARDPFSLAATAGLQYGRPDDPFTLGLAVMAPTTPGSAGRRRGHQPRHHAHRRRRRRHVARRPARRTTSASSCRCRWWCGRACRCARRRALTLALDVNWQRWSTNRRLVIDFAHSYPLLLTPGATMVDVTLDNRWRDTLSVRLGAEARPFARAAGGARGRAGATRARSTIAASTC